MNLRSVQTAARKTFREARVMSREQQHNSALPLGPVIRQSLHLLEHEPPSHSLFQTVVENIRLALEVEVLILRPCGPHSTIHMGIGASGRFDEMELRHCLRQQRPDEPSSHAHACLCRAVLERDPSLPVRHFTECGSFWTPRLDTLQQEPFMRQFLHARCLRERYQAMALVPIRPAGKPDALLQLNDRRQDFLNAGILAALDQVAAAIGHALYRQQTEVDLRLSRIALSSTPEMIFWTDGQAHILDVNEAACRGLQYSREELMQHALYDIASQPDLASWRRYWNEMRSRAPRRIAGSLCARNGTPFPVEGTVHYYGADGREYTVVVLTDLTQKQENEVLFHKMRQQVETASNLRRHFVNNLSHEIRTPMNAIIGFADLLKHTNLNPSQRDYVGMITSSGQLLVHFIDDLIDLSKIESGVLHLEQIDFAVENLLSNVFRIVRQKAQGKSVDIYYEIEPEVSPRLRGDPGRIQQILLHLLDNAIKFTPTGEISVQIRAEPGPRPGCQILLFDIWDTGIGISDENIQNIFQAFTQLDGSSTRKYGGAGLGLSIARALARMMEGDITVSSTPGQGSRFCVRLTCQSMVMSAPPGVLLPGFPLLHGKRGVVIDTNPRFFKAIEQFCRRAQIHLRLVSNPSFESIGGAPPDFILVNLSQRMIETKTFPVGAHTRALHGGIPKLIALVPTQSADLQTTLAQAGFDASVQKPFDGNELLGTLVTALAPATAPAEPPEHADRIALSILIVEDNTVTIKLLRILLEKLGCRTDVAVNGREAIRKMESSRFDLVLMDLQMPIMGGFEATSIIRSKISSRIPIIAFTASTPRDIENRPRPSA